MNKVGFALPLDLTASQQSGRSNLFGIGAVWPSESAARAEGYSTSYVDGGGQGSSVMGQYVASLTKEQQTAFDKAANGDEMDIVKYTIPGTGILVTKAAKGCNAQADIAVFGSVPASMKIQNFPNEVAAAIGGQVLNRDALEKISRSYSRCMTEKGYSVKSIVDTLQLAKDRFGASRPAGTAPGADELQMVLDDYSCQSKGKLAEQLNALYFKESASWVLKNENRILEFYADEQSALTRAKAIVQNEPSS